MTQQVTTAERAANGLDAPAVRVTVRPIGTPLPLGFLGLVIASTAMSALQLGWVAPDQGHAVALGILGFTVPLQLVASVFGFLARDPSPAPAWACWRGRGPRQGSSPSPCRPGR